jgi:glycosyltransferase involved in cell wall biosynthesis
MADDRMRPDVSVVVVVHDIPREARRTLLSLSSDYQRDIRGDEYEVVVVDNGSTPPVDETLVAGLNGTFRILRVENAPPSPAHAVNVGIAAARADIVGVMVDGARMVSPGLIHFARRGATLHDPAVVTALGWNLGFDSRQRWAVDCGYTREREDALLEAIGWPRDGYRLFDIAAFDSSSADGWFAPIYESTALFLRREAWEQLHGYDERFDVPGGGFVNLDAFRRASELPGARLVVLLGEGTFHQLHNGAASGAAVEGFEDTVQKWADQCEAITGRRWKPPPVAERTYVGMLPRSLRRHLVRAAVRPARVRPDAGEPPLGTPLDLPLWLLGEGKAPDDPITARLAALAREEFRAGQFEAATVVARLARSRAPEDPGLLRLLAFASDWYPGIQIASERRAAVAVARGDAYGLLGDAERAAIEYRSALELENGLARAHLGLAALRMPGESYLAWLRWLHETLRPEAYVEIGVANGWSISLALPSTMAIGVDPAPTVTSTLRTETHLFCEPSDEFFARGRLDRLLAGRKLGFAFIDGLHAFDQALRDFSNLEAYCSPAAVVAFHDTVPLDEVTQRPDRQTQFWTGDVWKALFCLKHYRQDLDIFTVATPPSGLTLVTGLDPSSRVLHDRHHEAVARFSEIPFSDVESRLSEELSIVPNDREAVSARLRAHGIGVPPGGSR